MAQELVSSLVSLGNTDALLGCLNSENVDLKGLTVTDGKHLMGAWEWADFCLENVVASDSLLVQTFRDEIYSGDSNLIIKFAVLVFLLSQPELSHAQRLDLVTDGRKVIEKLVQRCGLSYDDANVKQSVEMTTIESGNGWSKVRGFTIGGHEKRLKLRNQRSSDKDMSLFSDNNQDSVSVVVNENNLLLGCADGISIAGVQGKGAGARMVEHEFSDKHSANFLRTLNLMTSLTSNFVLAHDLAYNLYSEPKIDTFNDCRIGEYNTPINAVASAAHVRQGEGNSMEIQLFVSNDNMAIVVRPNGWIDVFTNTKEVTVYPGEDAMEFGGICSSRASVYNDHLINETITVEPGSTVMLMSDWVNKSLNVEHEPLASNVWRDIRDFADAVANVMEPDILAALVDMLADKLQKAAELSKDDATVVAALIQ